MEILHTDQFARALGEAAGSCQRAFQIYSAFIKADAFDRLASSVSDGVSGSVVARWRPADLLAGVSDLEVFEACTQRHWRFGINLNLHAKAYVFDNTMFVGSGNLTGAGLGFHPVSNQELGVMVKDPQINDVENLRRFEDEVCWLDANLFHQIKDALADIEELSFSGSELAAVQWPIELVSKLRKPVESLWVSDLTSAMPSFEPVPENHPLGNAAAGGGRNIDQPPSPELRENFLNSRLYVWLVRELKGASGYTNFGWLTSRLQSVLIDDPRPTRREVKDFTAMIFEWLEHVNPPEIELRSYRHTRGIVLKE